MVLDLTSDVVTLTRQLVDIESVSLNERAIADEIEAALRGLAHLEVSRHGHTLVARTELGRGERVVIAGHIDTVPVNDNLPARLDGPLLHGLGSCDMKGGDAVILRLAATVPEPNRDLTFILYEGEEIESEHNGLFQLSRSRPRADDRRLRDPDGAVERRGRGGLPGHPARRGAHDRGARPQRPLLEGRQRDPQGRRDPHPAERLRGAQAGDRRAGVPRGAQRGVHPRRRRRQRAARRVRGRGQLPVRAGPLGGRGRGVRARLLRRAST